VDGDVEGDRAETAAGVANPLALTDSLPPAGRQPPPTSPVRQALPFFYALLFAGLAAGAVLLAIELQRVLILVFVAVIFASAVASPAGWLERRGVPRGFAVGLVYLVAVGGFLAGLWLVVPPLLRDLARFVREAPALIGRVEALRGRYEPLREQYPQIGALDEELVAAGERVLGGVGGRLDRLPGDLFGFLFIDLFSVVILSLMIVLGRERMAGAILNLVAPARQAAVRRVLREMWHRVGLYLRARGITMVIVGALTWLSLALLGVPYALLLGVIAGIGEAIPQFGVWIARVPILAIAALHGGRTVLLVLAASVVIELIKGHLLTPLIEGRQLHVHPLVAVVAGLAGVSLLGLAGGFIALPAAAIVQVLYDEVLVPWRRAQLGLPPLAASAEPAPGSAPARRGLALRRSR